MPQTPVSANTFVNSSSPVTIYTVPAGRTAIINNLQGSSLLGAAFNLTVNKIAVDGTVYPIAVDRRNGDNVNYFTGNPTATSAPMSGLNGSITLAAGEAISASTTTSASFKIPQTYTGNGNLQQLIYASGRYVAVGFNSDSGRGLVLTSTDGQAWTPQTFSFFFTLNDVAGDASNRLVATSNSYSGGYFTSSNGGSTWTQVALSGGHSGTLSGVSYTNGVWFIYGPSAFYTSTDGITFTLRTGWTALFNGDTATPNSVVHDGTRYIITTSFGNVLTTDFLTFTSPFVFRGGATGTIPYAVVWHPTTSKFIATTNAANLSPGRYFMESTDGVNWTSLSNSTVFPSSQVPTFLESGGTGSNVLFALANGSNQGLYSINSGTAWTAFTNTNYSGYAIYNRCVSLGNGYFIWPRVLTYNYGCCGTFYTTGNLLVSQTPWSASFPATGYDGVSSRRIIEGASGSNNVNNGPWVVFWTQQSDNTIGWRGSSTGNGAQSDFTTTYGTGTYGTPAAVRFFNSQFWMITQSGYVFSLNAWNGTLTYVTRIVPNGTFIGLTVVNSRLCAIDTHDGSDRMIFSTDGISWGTSSVSYLSGPLGSSNSPCVASSGSVAVISCSYSRQIVTSSDGESWGTASIGAIRASNVNGNILLQTRKPYAANAFYDKWHGTISVTNPTISSGFVKVASNPQSASVFTLQNSIVFSNSSYLFSSPFALTTSLSIAPVTAGVSTTSINGATFMSATNYAVASSGSATVVADVRPSSGTTYKIGYLANVNFARSVAAVAASILEIS
jgi:hypothetical protein